MTLTNRREGKARKKKRSSVAGDGGDDVSDYSSESESDDDDGEDKPRYFILLLEAHTNLVEGRRRKGSPEKATTSRQEFRNAPSSPISLQSR